MITAAEAKAFMQITANTYDTLIASYIAQVSADIELYCDNVFNGVVSVTDENLDTTEPDEGVLFRGFPVSSVTVKHNGVTMTAETEYDLDTAAGALYILHGVEPGRDAYTASYSVGYAVNNVPTPLKNVALKAVKALFESNDSAKMGGGDVTNKKIGDFAVTYDKTKSTEEIVQDVISANAMTLNRYRRVQI